MHIFRILGEPSSNTNRRQRPSIQTQSTVESAPNHHNQLPPAYSTVLRPRQIASSDVVDLASSNGTTLTNDVDTTILHNRSHALEMQRRHTTTNIPTQSSLEKMESFSSTIPRRPTQQSEHSCTNRSLTAHDVAQLLRPSANQFQFQRLEQALTDSLQQYHEHQQHQQQQGHQQQSQSSSCSQDYSLDLNDDHQNELLNRSVEHLVANEAPIGESNAAAMEYLNRNGDDDIDVVDENKIHVSATVI